MARQVVKFAAVCAAAVSVWLLVTAYMAGWKSPEAAVSLRILQEKFADMSIGQKRMLRTVVKKYPLQSLLAAHRSGWQGLQELLRKGPDYTLEVPALAFQAASAQLDKVAAMSFIENGTSLLQAVDRLDPQYGEKLLQDLRELTADEYANMAFDPSYILIAPRLSPRQRHQFRRNQKLLTPLLTLIEPREWDRFMEMFERSQPRISEIVLDPALDEEYAWSYILNRDLVLQATGRGISERDAVHFLKLNAQTVREADNGKPVWIDDLSAMQTYAAAAASDGEPMSLFDWACADPSLYWAITQDNNPDKSASFFLMTRYAGSELPNILRLHYAAEPRLLQSALQALHRFDNSSDPSPERRNLASRFLNRYQNDDLFKDLLARHGALLIPALAVGGEKELAQIAANPNDIFKHIDEQGKPRSTWWQYIPGGSIVAVVRDLSAGRSVSTGEWAWAAFDAVTIVAVTATSVKALSSAKAIRAAQPVGRALTLGAAAARQGAWSQLKMRALPLLAASGKIAQKSALAVLNVVKNHPVKALAGALAVYYFINPEALNRHSRQIGHMAAAIPMAAVSGLWDQVASQLNRSPILSFFYYPILILFSLLVLGVILAALKHYLKPVWAMWLLLFKPFRMIIRKVKAR